ncbi:hypothetical protein D9M68_819850 [compost metagenome]
MRIDIIYFCRADTRIIQSVFHGKISTVPVRVRGRNMVGIRRKAPSYQLTVDLSPPGFGVLVFFQNQGGASLSQHKTVTVAVIRPGGRLRVIVPLGKCLEAVEAAYPRLGIGGFRSAGNTGRNSAQANVVKRIDDRIVGRRTGRNGHIVRPSEFVTDRDLTGDPVSNHLRNKEGVKARNAVALDIVGHFFLKGF